MRTPDPARDELDGEPTPRARLLAALRRPAARALFGATLIGLLALLYLNEVAGLTAANDQARALVAEQTRLERQDALLHAQLGSVTSPQYVDQRARALGLAPAPGATPITVAFVRLETLLQHEDDTRAPTPAPATTGGQP